MFSAQCGVQSNGSEGYQLAMESLDRVSEEAKIVGEEMDAFFSRAVERLNTLNPGKFSLEELSKEIRRLVKLRLGYPVAKAITTVKRAPNAWNQYQNGNYERVKMELGAFLFPKIPYHFR